MRLETPKQKPQQKIKKDKHQKDKHQYTTLDGQHPEKIYII